ncbi:response regulator transcription factor [Arthrobacter sp. NEB 688]|uniref:response regulator n=1 Tax=Arthrobacter sp. NEB 688 TaxID=904039 RepID=UPI001563A17B|nr:response regulator transcription factor [Arthrobacter sp. NEB 688]QKE82649.1 response regulator transcription factor [Arthrobacter sp. NEB 688]
MLLVDDHQMFAELLAESLTASGFEVVGICATLDAGLSAAAETGPDVVILDHRVPPGAGASMVTTFRRTAPAARILMLTASEERSVLWEAMDAGSDGFVTKRQSVGTVIAAVHAVLEGQTPVSPDMVGALVGRRAAVPGGDLSGRETEILQLLGAGWSNRDIATRLQISPNTVRNHVQHIFVKLDAHSKLEAVAVASRLGLLHSDRSRTVDPS